jgi:hypothetical protein
VVSLLPGKEPPVPFGLEAGWAKAGLDKVVSKKFPDCWENLNATVYDSVFKVCNEIFDAEDWRLLKLSWTSCFYKIYIHQSLHQSQDLVTHFKVS